MWEDAPHPYNVLSGAMASVISSTLQVESDFSIVKAEKEDFQTIISDLSLNVVLHFKQFLMQVTL